MAHKKGQGSTRNGRDSNPQYLGVKLFGGQLAKTGSIIVRQRGTTFKAGRFVKRGRDDTLFAMIDGKVVFKGRRIEIQPLPQDLIEIESARAPTKIVERTARVS